VSRLGTSETRELRDLATQLGFAISLTRRGHLKFTLKGAGIVVASRASGDWRALRHARAALFRVARRTGPSRERQP
jgi:hypothetical protein